MRRLPIYFVLDCSESMVGDKIKQMEDALQIIVRNLRSDPHALETVHFSVIAFAGIAKTIAPLVEVASFYPPKLPIGGGTNLGTALSTLMREIDKSVVKTTADNKGDWMPIIYLFTDGSPTDDPNREIEEWNAKYAGKAMIVAIGLGMAPDYQVLKRLTEHVILFENKHDGDFMKFVKWVTNSVVSQSKSIGEGVNLDKLPIIDESIMQLIENPPLANFDESCVVLIGRCQKSYKPYLMKYDRVFSDLSTKDLKLQLKHYEIAGCYPLSEEYFAWSDSRSINSTVNTSELIGIPGCPHCGAATAFAMCGCGKLLCLNGPGEATCPWCEKRIMFDAHLQESESNFDVGRGRG
jgi:uncharacterized protein YegL